jgi:DNA-directed RNA polymerase subunit RPC12/RpoP
MEIHIHDTIKCPKCGHEYQSSGKLTKHRPGINSGDFSGCGECGAILRIAIVDNKIIPRIPLEIEIKAVQTYAPELYTKLIFSLTIAQAIRSLKK